MGLKKILNDTLGSGRSKADKREDNYQRAEGMTGKGSSVQARRERRERGQEPRGAQLVRGLGERIGFAGIVVVTVLAAGVGLVGCKPGTAPPKPTTSCEEDQPCWDCTKDGNKRCGDVPPAVKATCDEPAAWCHRGDDAEAVQR